MKSKKAYDLSNFKILIVEDFEFIRGLLMTSLKEMGVGEVITAENGRQGKEKILSSNSVYSSANIDAVIMDWLMPVMDGEALLQWIRSHSEDTIKFLPTVVCTAYASTDLVEHARDLGCNELLVKPISAEKIAQRIQYVIDKPRPFIKCPEFFGPDRRRREQPYRGPDRRKMKSEEITKHVEELT